MTPSAELLYDTFAPYQNAGRQLCSFCYEPDEWQEIARTPLRVIGIEPARKLLWETADHWENADVYRHYLPRLLEVLLPPALVEPLYPLHPSETLLSLGFRQWTSNERNAVLDYLEAATPFLTWLRDDDDRQEWNRGMDALKREGRLLLGNT